MQVTSGQIEDEMMAAYEAPRQGREMNKGPAVQDRGDQ